MKISCPQCGFSREVPPDRMPSGTAIATCPKCGCRFRIGRQKTAQIHDFTPPPAGPEGVRKIPPAYVHRETHDENFRESSRENPAGNGEEEDIRVTASKAYAAEAERYEREMRGEEERKRRERAINPWDTAPGPMGWVGAFCQTVLRVLFSANLFFSAMRPQCQQWRPLLFYLVICVIQTSVEQIWSGMFISMLETSAATDPQLQGMLEMLGPRSNFAFTLLLRCGLLAGQLYFLSFLMYLMFRLAAPGRSTFPLIFQIMAYSSAPALLCIVPIIGSIAGWVWSLACLLIGCKAAMRLDWPRTLCGLVPLVLVFAPVLFQIMVLFRQ